MESSRDDEKAKREALELELSELRRKYDGVVMDNGNFKAEVQKGVEDIAKALGDGYGRCLARASAVGFDVNGHSFEDYIRDYAASNPGGST